MAQITAAFERGELTREALHVARRCLQNMRLNLEHGEDASGAPDTATVDIELDRIAAIEVQLS